MGAPFNQTDSRTLSNAYDPRSSDDTRTLLRSVSCREDTARICQRVTGTKNNAQLLQGVELLRTND